MKTSSKWLVENKRIPFSQVVLYTGKEIWFIKLACYQDDKINDIFRKNNAVVGTDKVF